MLRCTTVNVSTENFLLNKTGSVLVLYLANNDIYLIAYTAPFYTQMDCDTVAYINLNVNLLT